MWARQMRLLDEMSGKEEGIEENPRSQLIRDLHGDMEDMMKTLVQRSGPSAMPSLHRSPSSRQSGSPTTSRLSFRPGFAR